MQIEYSIPLALALVAFIIADSEGLIVKLAVKKSFLLPGKQSVQARLSQLGRSTEEDYQNFRIAQLSYASVFLLILSAGFLLAIIEFVPYICLFLISYASVLILTDRSLTKKCAKKSEEIEDELPAVIEMLTLSVGAGESPAASMKRIAFRATGHLAREFRSLVEEIEKGTSFTSGLDAMSKRVQSENLRRFADSLIISTSRGTPLVETLAHSANEARNRERVSLMAAAGKSEISMMIPVVFLILPISILFALFPSLSSLNLFAH